MCGISGLVQLEGVADTSAMRRSVETMVKALAHRGPDDSGVAGDGSAVFGMARLAIRGCHDGRQPMVDAETGVMMVCNGEIDNHAELRGWLAERGRAVEHATDVAVIPGLYLELGDGFVERLVGAFALAVWDPRRGRLLLARDRAGERPLFYACRDGRVSFASQAAALVAGSPEPYPADEAAVQAFLKAGYFEAPASPFAGMRKVLPGERIAIDVKGVERSRYWRLNFTRGPARKNPLDEFDAVFREAVRRQSEVEVDFGAFLSGGVDSSLVTAVMRSVHPDRKLKAFGLRFSESSYDEGVFAERVAESLGVDYTPIWVRPEDFPETLADLVRQSGEPLADPAWVPTALLARRASDEVRVALVGEGADELFGGYPTYFGARLAERYSRLPGGLRALIRKAVEAWPVSDKKVTVSFLLKRFVQGDELDFLARHVLWTSSIPPALLRRLGVTPPETPHVAGPQETMLDRLQQHDLETSLAEGLLTKADRASMRSALELRAPFLDKDVIEFAATLPERERVQGLETKVFLKRVALRYLPKDIVYRKKRGLSVPLSAWLRGPLHDWAEARISSPRLEELGINRAAALELLREHERRSADHARALWTLIVVSEWLEWKAGMEAHPAAFTA
ncbi:asparagine synthetase, glutamine-hydrolyzing [Methylococcus capsulatus str. Bath]|uniref:asparagine synthase (glutamine-hydrolyzing) n=1 Tax=Methylococcus capsulatus (strain ATCC 33009 / NCIMB 11132 / Bath) TaxID=243233 RepID=Q60BJ4_METCA|nr:asparagine synthase (glutamine-hydrolyzing) [Methylococcus capsulatus]AAU90350.1 asparagine synthetase, glutamine-hydrolyzing [Methylococcus capsulatus str. Bath]